jgi:hypothetical protein
MTSHRRIPGVLASAFGVALAIPAGAAYVSAGELPGSGVGIVVLSVLLVLVGVVWIFTGRRDAPAGITPAPVRAAIMGNILMLSFFVLEFSDGLIRQDGRVFYWTSVLFLPALVLLYGLVRAQRWAWWVARVAVAALALWFAVFLVAVPFVDLRRDGVPVPWWGRVYMMTFTLLLGGAMVYVFRALGSRDARAYFNRK